MWLLWLFTFFRDSYLPKVITDFRSSRPTPDQHKVMHSECTSQHSVVNHPTALQSAVRTVPQAVTLAELQQLQTPETSGEIIQLADGCQITLQQLLNDVVAAD